MRANQIQASVPAEGAKRPKRGPMPTVHFSMARTVHFSMAIDTMGSRRNGPSRASPMTPRTARACSSSRSANLLPPGTPSRSASATTSSACVA